MDQQGSFDHDPQALNGPSAAYDEVLRDLIFSNASQGYALTESEGPSQPVEVILGGAPNWPASRWPADKQGEPMVCVARTDLSNCDVPGLSQDHQGVLAIFISSRHQDYQTKDRTRFQVIWQPNGTLAHQDGSAPGVVLTRRLLRIERRKYFKNKAILSAQRTCGGKSVEVLCGLNEKELGPNYLLAEYHPEFQEAQAIAAFASNGVSFTHQRLFDSCYDHLRVAADAWRLVLRLCGDPLPEIGIKELLLLMHEDDLNQGLFEKAWLVVT